MAVGEQVIDSPYRTSEPILTPIGGVVAGMGASLLMLLVISLLHPFSALSAKGLLMRFGLNVVPRAGAARDSVLLLTAGCLHVTVGAMLGLLYAVSQQRIATRGLITVGVFYGFVIWVVSHLLASLLFRSSLPSVLRSYPWLLACLFYGLFLAGCAVWAARRHPLDATQPVPID